MGEYQEEGRRTPGEPATEIAQDYSLIIQSELRYTQNTQLEQRKSAQGSFHLYS
jgi:hypothetical protein